MSLKLGFESYSSGGPGIFLSRLQTEMEALGCFSLSEPDAWIQLSFKPLPPEIRARQQAGRTRVIVRMDGASCWRWHAIRKPVPVSVPLLDTWYSRKLNRKKNREILKNLQLADQIIYQSHFSRKITHEFVTWTPPGSIIMNGIDLSPFARTGEAAETAQPDRVQMLMSHSFRPSHRLHDAFRILSRLNGEGRARFFLNIVGGDEDGAFAYAKTVAKRLGLVEGRDYRFWGRHEAAQLPSIYRACNFMLNLSFWDACPNVVIEALACGLPVVGTGHGGLAEVVGADGGLLVPEDIPFRLFDRWNFKTLPLAPVAAYVDAIHQLLPKLSADSIRARARAERCFDIRTVAKDYLQVIQSAL